MAEDKAPYKLTVELDSARPDALSKAMEQLRDIAGELDVTGKAKATIVFEDFKQAPLNEIMDEFEEWLYQFAIGLGCQMKVQRPGLRPESISKFRERYATPMDDSGWNQADDMRDDFAPEFPDEQVDAMITPDTHERMALPTPRLMLTVADGDFVIEDEREEA